VDQSLLNMEYITPSEPELLKEESVC